MDKFDASQSSPTWACISFDRQYSLKKASEELKQCSIRSKCACLLLYSAEGKIIDRSDIAEQFEKHLSSPKQTWLLGAGASYCANIPLMTPLTERVLNLALTDKFSQDETSKNVITFLRNDVREDANIEEILTHLADLISLSERARTSSVTMNGTQISKHQLQEVHVGLLELIADTIRCGYRPATLNDDLEVAVPEIVGSREKPIVKVDAHVSFIEALYGSGRAGLENRRPAIELFTTNYDTLIEDALALNGVKYHDGFVGGGVAYWSGLEALNSQNHRAVVTKLHGSIDWYRSSNSQSNMVRRRFGDAYPAEGGVVMIFPQATKYVHAQKNPFAELFQRFRHRLHDGKDQVLFVCGYSFGDDHINAEIDHAMSAEGSQLTLLAFAHEPDAGLPATLEQWRKNRSWSERVFIASPKGLYQGGSDAVFSLAEAERNWWTFEGASKLFRDGIPTDIQDSIE